MNPTEHNTRLKDMPGSEFAPEAAMKGGYSNMLRTTQLPPMADLDEFLNISSRKLMMMEAVRTKILDDASNGIFPDDSDAYRVAASILFDNITICENIPQYNADLKLLQEYMQKRSETGCDEYIWHDGFNLEETMIVVGLNMLFTDVKSEKKEACQLLTDLLKRYKKNLYRQAKKLNVFNVRQTEGFTDVDDIPGSVKDLSIVYITCRINKIPIEDSGWLIINLISQVYQDIRDDEEDSWDGFESEEARLLTDFVLGFRENEKPSVQEPIQEPENKPSSVREVVSKDEKDREIRELKEKIQELQYKADRQRELYELEREKALRLKKELDIAAKQMTVNVESEAELTDVSKECLPEPSSEEMIRLIKDRKIMIIGGHENWVYKLRNMFPKWTYLSPKEQGTIPVSVVSGTEVIYFFSNHICHPQYNRFLNAARVKNIPVKYISKVNVNDNIRQIYSDIKAVNYNIGA